VVSCVGIIYFSGPKNTSADDPKAAEALIAKVKGVSGIELVSIPNGSFLMGSPPEDKDANDDEKPQHKVTISKPFYMGKYKVTLGQFKRFVAATDYTTEDEDASRKWTWKKPSFDDRSFEQTDEHPVLRVSWNDADVYCAWLAKETGAKVRLPSEAEWEYSCRAVREAKPTTKFYFGDNMADLGNYAWYTNNTNNKGTQPCGLKKPNAFGLYDMHGLTWEWCADWYGPYPKGEIKDMNGPENGKLRVLRGASWYGPPAFCRSASRHRREPSYSFDDVGYRVVFCLD
jgi:formylglycine-generating enzyme required for sulfatase activity